MGHPHVPSQPSNCTCQQQHYFYPSPPFDFSFSDFYLSWCLPLLPDLSLAEVKCLRERCNPRVNYIFDALSEKDGSCNLSKYSRSELIQLRHVGRGALESLEVCLSELDLLETTNSCESGPSNVFVDLTRVEVRALKNVTSERVNSLLDALSEEDGSCNLSNYSNSDLMAMRNIGRGTLISLKTGIAILRKGIAFPYVDIDLRDIRYIKSISSPRVCTLLDALIAAYPLREGYLRLSELHHVDLYGVKGAGQKSIQLFNLALSRLQGDDISEEKKRVLAQRLKDVLKGNNLSLSTPMCKEQLSELFVSDTDELQSVLLDGGRITKLQHGSLINLIERLETRATQTIHEEAFDLLNHENRDCKIVSMYSGFFGPSKTLEETGKAFSVTRGRIRQVMSKVFRGRRLTRLAEAVVIVKSKLPSSEEQIHAELVAGGYIDPRMSLKDFFRYAQARDMKIDHAFCPVLDSGVVVIPANCLTSTRELLNWFRHHVKRFGIVQMTEWSEQCSSRKTVSVKLVEAICDASKLVVDQQNGSGWVSYPNGLPAYTGHIVIRKNIVSLLNVAGGELDHREILEALRAGELGRFSSENRMITPPPEVFLKVLGRTSCFVVDGDVVSISSSNEQEATFEKHHAELEETDCSRMIEIMRSSKDGWLFRRTFEALALEEGVDTPSFWRNLTYSGYFKKIRQGVFSLIGAKVKSESIDVATPPEAISGGPLNRGYLPNGFLWQTFVLSTWTKESGVFNVPDDIKYKFENPIELKELGEETSQCLKLSANYLVYSIKQQVDSRELMPGDLYALVFPRSENCVLFVTPEDESFAEIFDE